MTKNLYLIRHGKTIWNLEGKLQGKCGDSPLLTENEALIKQLSKEFNKIRIDKIVHSGSERAKITGKILAKEIDFDGHLDENKNFCEFDLGKMEGSTVKLADQKFDNSATLFLNNPFQYNSTKVEGECATDAVKRFEKGLMEVFSDLRENDSAIVISHGGVIKSFLSGLMTDQKSKEDILKDGVANLSVTKLCLFNDKISIKMLADTSFLPDSYVNGGVR